VATTGQQTQTEQRRETVRGHILFTFGVILALALAWKLRGVLEITYVSALFAVVLTPVVQHIMKMRIGKWRPSRLVAIVALVAAVFMALTGFLIVGLPPVIHDVQRFASDLPARVPMLLEKLRRVPLADKLGVNTLAERGETMVSSFASYLLASFPLWMGRVLDMITAFVLCIYFMLEGEAAYKYFLSFFQDATRERLARTLVVAEHRMSKWLLGQLALMLILGVASTIVFASLHVRYFFLLGVLMGLFNIVPVVGGIITILLSAGVAAMDSWTKMAGVLIFYAIYVQIENGYLTPRIMRTSVDLMALSVLIALMAGLALAGVVGALVAVPTAALVAVLMNEYMVQKPDDELQQEAQAEP
jgi:predicted PurR-regulated permease PerM